MRLMWLFGCYDNIIEWWGLLYDRMSSEGCFSIFGGLSAVWFRTTTCTLCFCYSRYNDDSEVGITIIRIWIMSAPLGLPETLWHYEGWHTMEFLRIITRWPHQRGTFSIICGKRSIDVRHLPIHSPVMICCMPSFRIWFLAVDMRNLENCGKWCLVIGKCGSCMTTVPGFCPE